jgi:hypothetical protein
VIGAPPNRRGGLGVPEPATPLRPRGFRERWEKDGGGLSERWEGDGGGLKERWEKDGGGLKERWERDGRG